MYTLVISAFRRERQMNLCEFKVSLIYIASFRPVKATDEDWKIKIKDKNKTYRTFSRWFLAVTFGVCWEMWCVFSTFCVVVVGWEWPIVLYLWMLDQNWWNVLEVLGVMVFLEGVYHWEWALRFKRPTPFPVISLLSYLHPLAPTYW